LRVVFAQVAHTQVEKGARGGDRATFGHGDKGDGGRVPTGASRRGGDTSAYVFQVGTQDLGVNFHLPSVARARAGRQVREAIKQ
jgi:hypothetical protein